MTGSGWPEALLTAPGLYPAETSAWETPPASPGALPPLYTSMVTVEAGGMGAVAFAKFHDGNLAVILILAFTAISGLVAPVAENPQAQEQANASPKEGPRLVEGLKA